jgi:hypothetical protein
MASPLASLLRLLVNVLCESARPLTSQELADVCIGRQAVRNVGSLACLFPERGTVAAPDSVAEALERVLQWHVRSDLIQCHDGYYSVAHEARAWWLLQRDTGSGAGLRPVMGLAETAGLGLAHEAISAGAASTLALQRELTVPPLRSQPSGHMTHTLSEERLRWLTHLWQITPWPTPHISSNSSVATATGSSHPDLPRQLSVTVNSHATLIDSDVVEDALDPDNKPVMESSVASVCQTPDCTRWARPMSLYCSVSFCFDVFIRLIFVCICHSTHEHVALVDLKCCCLTLYSGGVWCPIGLVAIA